MPQRYGSDEIDDILSSIMQKSATLPKESPPPAPKPLAKSAVVQQKPQVPTAPLVPTSVAHAKPATPTQTKPVHIQAPARKYRYKKRLLAVPFVVLLLVGSVLLARPIAAFLMPSAPFTKELVEKTNYPLLYPGILPSGYTVDKDTISQSDDQATVYAIKNKDGNPITISLQEQPSGLNLQPLYDTMAEVKSVDIPAGKTTIGVSKDKMITAHTLTGSVWVIARTPVDGGLDHTDLENMLKTLKAAQ